MSAWGVGNWNHPYWRHCLDCNFFVIFAKVMSGLICAACNQKGHPKKIWLATVSSLAPMPWCTSFCLLSMCCPRKYKSSASSHEVSEVRYSVVCIFGAHFLIKKIGSQVISAVIDNANNIMWTLLETICILRLLGLAPIQNEFWHLMIGSQYNTNCGEVPSRIPAHLYSAQILF